MSRIEAARALQTLVRVYRRELSGDEINEYIRAWSNLDPGLLMMAVEQHAVYSRQFPTPGQIVVTATRESAPSLIPPASRAWEGVVRVVKHQWWYHTRVRFDATVNVTLDLMGGFKRVGNRIRDRDDDVEAEFVATYEYLTGLRETLGPDQEEDSAQEGDATS